MCFFKPKQAEALFWVIKARGSRISKTSRLPLKQRWRGREMRDVSFRHGTQTLFFPLFICHVVSYVCFATMAGQMHEFKRM